MSLRIETRFVVGRFTLNPDDENADFSYLQDIVSLWSQSEESLAQRRATHDGCSALVRFDWRPVAEVLDQQLQMSRLLRHSPRELPSDWWEVYSTNTRVHVSVEIEGTNKLSKLDWYPDFFVENALYDLFTVLNLALPSSADFNYIGLEQTGRIPRERLSLSAYYLDDYFSRKFVWPRLSKMSLASVDRWYKRVRNGVGQVPETPVERAIFALLHVCQSTGKPEDIVWLFYGYESLFQTKTGENFSSLMDRISLLLAPNEDELKLLRKHLRSMYDHRSSFVHGGLQVIHPARHDSIDPRIQSKYGDIVDLSVFGTRLLVACLQRYVAENWSAVAFKTSMLPANGEA